MVLVSLVIHFSFSHSLVFPPCKFIHFITQVLVRWDLILYLNFHLGSWYLPKLGLILRFSCSFMVSISALSPRILLTCVRIEWHQPSDSLAMTECPWNIWTKQRVVYVANFCVEMLEPMKMDSLRNRFGFYLLARGPSDERSCPSSSSMSGS